MAHSFGWLLRCVQPEASRSAITPAPQEPTLPCFACAVQMPCRAAIVAAPLPGFSLVDPRLVTKLQLYAPRAIAAPVGGFLASLRLRPGRPFVILAFPLPPAKKNTKITRMARPWAGCRAGARWRPNCTGASPSSPCSRRPPADARAHPRGCKTHAPPRAPPPGPAPDGVPGPTSDSGARLPALACAGLDGRAASSWCGAARLACSTTAASCKRWRNCCASGRRAGTAF
jgi:hypothetical protein